MPPTSSAQKILHSLALGLDPDTGSPLDASQGFVLQQPDVIRALFLAVDALASRPGRTPQSRTGRPGKAGQPWSEDEDQRLAAAFDAGGSIAGLARDHQRSRGAITSRLLRLGRMPVGASPVRQEASDGGPGGQAGESAGAA